MFRSRFLQTSNPECSLLQVLSSQLRFQRCTVAFSSRSLQTCRRRQNAFQGTTRHRTTNKTTSLSTLCRVWSTQMRFTPTMISSARSISRKDQQRSSVGRTQNSSSSLNHRQISMVSLSFTLRARMVGKRLIDLGFDRQVSREGTSSLTWLA